MNHDYLNQHSRPITRREWLSRGLTGAAGYAMAPTVLSMLNQHTAQADGLAPAPTPRFITFDCAGGAALFANFLVGGAGGSLDLLPSYSKLGWSPRNAGAVDDRFGLPMAGQGVSKTLVGMLQNMSAEAQAGFRMSSLLHIGQIDTSENPLSILSLVANSGVSSGLDLPSALGLSQSPSGGRSKPLADLATHRAYFIKDLPTLLNAVGLGGAFAQSAQIDRRRVAKLLERLSSAQLSKLVQGGMSSQAREYLGLSVSQVGPKADGVTGMDPRQSADFRALYNIEQNSDPASAPVLRASLVMNTLRGSTGPCVIEIGGCDYHDGSQATGDGKDQEIGLEIGRAIEGAKRLKVPLFIHVITDGGIYPQEGSRTWQGDSVETCMSVIGYYDPNSTPKYAIKGRTQLGHYTAQQGADRTTLIGSSPALAANVALANYMHVSGKLDQLPIVYPASLPIEQLKPLMAFEV